MKNFAKSPNKIMSQSSVAINEKTLTKQQQKILEILNTQNFSKPTNVEAQRILKILEDLLLNTEILTFIDTYFISEFYDLSQSKLSQADINSLSPELLSLLQKQAKYENDFKELERQEDQSLKDEELQKKQLEQRSEGDEDEETNEEEKNRLRLEKINRQRKRKQEKIQVNHLMQNNLKNLMRHLRFNSDDFTIIKGMKTQSNDMLKLKTCIRCVNYIMMKKLSTAAEEKDSHEKQLKELEERIKALESTTKKQEEELNKTKKERKKFTDEKQEEIQKYKDSIKSIKDKKQRDLENIKNTTDQNIKALTADHQQKVDNLKKELEKVEKELAEIKKKNQEMETKSLTSKKQYESNLKDLIETYDKEMSQQGQKLGELQKEYNVILKKKNDYQEYFDKLKKDEEREKKISEIWEKKEKEHSDDLKKKAEAASHLQSMVKEYLFRKKKKKGKKRGMGKK